MRIVGALVAAVLAVSAMLSGCANQQANQSSSAPEAAPSVVRLGTMPTEDILPIWVAEQEGFFATEGVQVQVEVFDSAPALTAAITAGQVDLAMTDIMRAVKLCESGTPVDLEWVTLGTTADQGRFGVLAAADAPYNSLTELAQWVAAGNVEAGSGVGVAANTVPEYAFDALVAEAGLPADAIPTVEVASLPERYGLVASGKLLGAALPNSLLTMGETGGLKVIADDTKGANISQSVMVARSAFAQENASAIEAVARAWDKAAEAINAQPAAYKELLFQRANIKPELSKVYVVSTYPLALNGAVLAHPSSAMVAPYLEWMNKKGYGAVGVSYDEKTGAFTV